MFPELAALLFVSREFAHRAHLQTPGFSEHKALEEFYTELTELTDKLVEVYQGRHGVISIPFCDAGIQPTTLETLKGHMAIIESVRMDAIGPDTPIQNIVDEIVGVYLRTIYKLTRLH